MQLQHEVVGDRTHAHDDFADDVYCRDVVGINRTVTDGPGGDSAIVISDGTGRLVNQNDCRTNDLLALRNHGPVDLHWLQYSGAIWYPMVYQETPERMRELIDAKVDSQFSRAMRYVETIGARAVVRQHQRDGAAHRSERDHRKHARGGKVEQATLVVGDGGADTDTLAVSGAVSLGSIISIEAIELTTGANLTLSTSQIMAGLAPNTQVGGSGTITTSAARITCALSSLSTGGQSSTIRS